MPFLLVGALILGIGAMVATANTKAAAPRSANSSALRKPQAGGQGQFGVGGYGNTGADTVGTGMSNRSGSVFLPPFGSGPDVGSLPIPISTPSGGSMSAGPLPFTPSPTPTDPVILPVGPAPGNTDTSQPNPVVAPGQTPIFWTDPATGATSLTPVTGWTPIYGNGSDTGTMTLPPFNPPPPVPIAHP